MKLYQISNEYLEALDELKSIPEINNDVIENSLAPITDNFLKKSINIAAYIKNSEAEIKIMNEYIKNMAERKNKIQKEIENIKNYLRFNMEKTNINKIKSPEFNISLGTEDSSVEIIDENILPIDYCRKIEKFEPDKIKIKKAIQEGGFVDGAKLIIKKRLTIN